MSNRRHSSLLTRGLALVAVALIVLLFFNYRNRAWERVERDSIAWGFSNGIRWLSIDHHRAPKTQHEVDDDGNPLYSWRFFWYMNSGPDWGPYRYAAWDDPVNEKFTTRTPSEYCYYYVRETTHKSIPDTYIFALTGPGTAFENPNVPDWDSVPDDTIILVEVANSGHHWMKPGDFDIRTMPRTIGVPGGISSRFAEGFHVGFADREVWFISTDVPFEELEKFFTVDGANKHDRETILGPYRIQ